MSKYKQHIGTEFNFKCNLWICKLDFKKKIQLPNWILKVQYSNNKQTSVKNSGRRPVSEKKRNIPEHSSQTSWANFHKIKIGVAKLNLLACLCSTQMF